MSSRFCIDYSGGREIGRGWGEEEQGRGDLNLSLESLVLEVALPELVFLMEIFVKKNHSVV